MKGLQEQMKDLFGKCIEELEAIIRFHEMDWLFKPGEWDDLDKKGQKFWNKLVVEEIVRRSTSSLCTSVAMSYTDGAQVRVLKNLGYSVPWRKGKPEKIGAALERKMTEEYAIEYVAIMKSQKVKKADAIAALEQDGLPKGAATAHYRNPVVKAAIATVTVPVAVGKGAYGAVNVVKDMSEAIADGDPMGGLGAGYSGIKLLGGLFPSVPKSGTSRFVKPWANLLKDLQLSKKNLKAYKPGGCCCSVM